MIFIMAVTILALLSLMAALYIILELIVQVNALHAFISRLTESPTRHSDDNLNKIKPDVACSNKHALPRPAINDEFSTPSGEDLNNQSFLRLMDEKNLIVLEKERLENELSLVQSQLTDSHSKLLQQFHIELATTKSELENNKREISDIKEKNLRLANDDSCLRRKVEDRDMTEIASSQAEEKELKNRFDVLQLDTVHDKLAISKREPELRNRAVTRIQKQNLRLMRNDKRLRRKMEHTNRVLLSSKAEVEEVRVYLNNQTETFKHLAIENNLFVLDKERLENELSLLQSQLTDSSSKLQMFQNVHDELATTKSELEEKERVITEIIAENVHLTTENSVLMRKIEAKDRLFAYKRAKLEELHNFHEEKKLHKVHDELASSQRALVSKNRAIIKLQEQNQESRAELEQLRTSLDEQKLDTRELAVATRELESKSRTITELEAKNLSLAENDSQLRRKMEDTNRLLLSSKAEVEELRASLNNQTDTIEQLGDHMSSLTPRKGEEVGIIVEKPNEIPATIEQFETLQNNPESLNFQTREAIHTIESLSDEMPADNQEPVEVRPSNQQLGMDEKQPELESLAGTIDDTENVTNKNQQLLGGTELTEIAEETIIPEESEQVEQKPSKAQSNKSTDNQFRHSPGDQQVVSQISEKSDSFNKKDNQPRHIPEDPHALPPNPEKCYGKTGNPNPKHFQIRVLRGVDLPEAKDSEEYYVSVSTRVQKWCGKIREHDNKKVSKTKTIRGSQPEWNKDFTIKTQNPEECLITMTLKKSSKLGLKKSTVGSNVIYVSDIKVNQVNRLRLFKQIFKPLGNAYVEFQIVYPLPEVIPSPENVSKPKETPAEVRPSNEQLETDEKNPEPKSPTDNLHQTIDDDKIMTNKDPVLSETDELLEMAEETIIPEVEQQQTKAKSKTTDHQPRLITKDPHALPPNPEKSQHPQKQNGTMDEKPEAAEPHPDCKQGKRTPKNFQIKFVRGVNLPEAKDSDQYYVSMRLEEWHGMNRVQSKKIKTKIIRGSNPEWNQNFTIKTQNPEKWMMVIKLKKLSKWGLKTSITVFSFVIGVHKMKVNEINRLKLYDCYFPAGNACLEVEYKIDYLPEVISSSKIISEQKETPAEVPPSREHELEMDEKKKPEPKSPTENFQQTIDDGKNMTNKDAEVGETEAEAFQKVVEQQPASSEAQSLLQQSTDGYQPTKRNYTNDLFVNPSPAPKKTLFDILATMDSWF
ncbi:hypothetical protein DAPPUDRAFT_108769 [Daphnia pulex]|uniref:C2 domain-containing protein n=1 Tax=Daphnia pulex TaxID=6669 RepID=E9H145_DAPPU|nr:hypothetical protein DAPPUDRAFT_108769 [Daphnia pulex]|eukprot:EFX74568.1 hypothetical protein DAPPUDRAFT_108769 [Daphnia pulex]